MALGKTLEKLALAARGGLALPAVCCCCWWFVWFRFWTEQEREREVVYVVEKSSPISTSSQTARGEEWFAFAARPSGPQVAQFPASSHAYRTAFRGVGARACEALQYASRVAHWSCVRVFLLVVVPLAGRISLSCLTYVCYSVFFWWFCIIGWCTVLPMLLKNHIPMCCLGAFQSCDLYQLQQCECLCCNLHAMISLVG